MKSLSVLPDRALTEVGVVSTKFLSLGIETFLEACRFVHELPYGYNSDRDELLILFREGKGSCTTKHAVIATLAQELGLPVGKQVGVYALAEALVTGAGLLLEKYRLPYVPMLHCFLVSGPYRVDLTEGNRNGKNRPIDDFLYTHDVAPNIRGKEEYLLYRRALADPILLRPELRGIDITTILHAREEALALLTALVAEL